MRPLELRLRDFKSYFGKETTFDFRGRRLVGIVGPIGSGKSSLLDAISFALYGKAPNTKGTTPLIHQRAAGAAVSLRFEAEGEVWEVTRALRRKGQGQHVLVRLDGDGPEANAVEKITMKSEVDHTVVDVLGLDYDAFTKSVLLAQGRFAEFLESGPADRDRVLKRVFGHDRLDAMRTVAKERAGELQLEADRLAVRLEDLERVTERLAADREQLATLDVRLEQLRKLEPRLADLDAAIDASERRLARLDEGLAELDAIATRLPDPTATSQTLEQAETFHRNRTELAESLRDAEAALVSAETAAGDLAADRAALERTAERLAQYDERRRSLTEATEAVRAAERRVTDAAATVAEVSRRADELRTDLGALERAALEAAERHAAAVEAAHGAMHRNMAATLVATLEVGEPCPVCAQSVDDIPEVVPPRDVARAEAALAEAEQALADARTAVATRSAEVAAAVESGSVAEEQLVQRRAEHDEAIERVEVLSDGLEALHAELFEALGEEPFDEATGALRRSIASREEQVAAGRRSVAEARRRIEALDEASNQVRRRIDDIRLKAAEIAGVLGETLDMSGSEPAAIHAALDTIRSAWMQRRDALRADRTTADDARALAVRSRDELLADHELDRPFAQVLSEAAAEAAVLHRTIAEAEERLVDADSLRARTQEVAASAEAFRRVASDLTDSRFVRYLLDDERARLAELGAEHFQLLTSGRYRFAEDGTFDIVDLTAADAVRSAQSLSGGETFLASLALALALAEMVARQGGRLDAFFLDEGFGTLDPEHLDLAMEGIERLVASNDSRFVAVVSHVPELRQRIDDLIRLDRDPVTGDTRVVRG